MISFFGTIKKLWSVGWKMAAGAVFVFFISILSVHSILPKLHDNPFFGKFKIFQYEGKNVTVINNREEVVMKEDDSYPDIVTRSRGSFVRVLSAASAETASVSENTSWSEGNGVILTNDGLVVTDASIMDNISLPVIITSEGISYNAKVIGVDSFLRLGFLKMDGSNYSSVPIADSRDVRVGQRLLSLATSQTSSGISVRSLLAHERAQLFNISPSAFATADTLEGVVLMDGSPSKQEVGAGVVNLKGELVGVLGLRSVDSSDDWYIIPSNDIRLALDTLSASQTKRSSFGLSYTSINPDIARKYNLPVSSGAWVALPGSKQASPILAHSPAESIGIRSGDIITSVSGEAVDVEHPFSNLLHAHRNDVSLEITVVRSGKPITLRGEWK